MAGRPNEGEREFETGKDEAASTANIRIGRSGVSFDSAIESLVLQSFQNAIETANMVSKNAVTSINLADKQAIAHRDIAVDATWDPGPGEESLKDDD